MKIRTTTPASQSMCVHIITNEFTSPATRDTTQCTDNVYDGNRLYDYLGMACDAITRARIVQYTHLPMPQYAIHSSRMSSFLIFFSIVSRLSVRCRRSHRHARVIWKSSVSFVHFKNSIDVAIQLLLFTVVHFSTSSFSSSSYSVSFLHRHQFTTDRRQ